VFYQYIGVVMSVPSQTDRQMHYVLDLSVRPSVRLSVCLFVGLSVCSSVTKLVNTIFWKWLNRFWCQLAQVVYRARASSSQLWGSWG